MKRTGPRIASLFDEVGKVPKMPQFRTCGWRDHAPSSASPGTGEVRQMAQELWKKKLEQAALNFRERRTGPRYSFAATAEVLEPQTNSRMPGRASDLDRGGCFIDTLNPFPAGTTLALRLSNENQSFRAKAEVAYVLTGMGMGLSFTTADAGQLRILDEWIAGLADPVGLTRPKPEPHQQGAGRAELQGTERARELEPPSILKSLIFMLIEKRILSHIEGAALVDDLPR